MVALPAHDTVIRTLGLGSRKTPDSSRPGHHACVESQGETASEGLSSLPHRRRCPSTPLCSFLFHLKVLCFCRVTVTVPPLEQPHLLVLEKRPERTALHSLDIHSLLPYAIKALPAPRVCDWPP